MQQIRSDVSYLTREKRRLLIQKNQYSCQLLENSEAGTTCGHVGNIYYRHKTSLKRLERILIKKDINSEWSKFELENGRCINAQRYINNLHNLCKTFTSYLLTIKLPEQKTSLAAALEGVNLHLETINLLEQTINYVSPNRPREFVSTPERNGESGRAPENEICQSLQV